MTNTLQNKEKILVSGYYGYNNIGDEAILKGLVDGISSKCDADIVVLSKNPDWTSFKYNVKSVNRSNIFEIIKEVRDCDMILSGGGSLLQDVTSKKSILYYLAILRLGLLYKKKTFIYSQGIGPITLKRNRYLTKKILNKVDFINVRDSQSARELNELGVNREVLVTTDTVFGINKPSKDEGKLILEGLGVKEEKLNIAFTIMNWKNYGSRTIEEIKKSIEILLGREDVNVILIPFFYHLDLEVERKIYNSLREKYENIYLVEEYLHVESYLSLVGNIDIMVSMRLHGLVFGTLMGAYPIGISYDPKIDGFMKELDRVQRLYVENFKAEEVAEEVFFAISNLKRLREETNNHLGKFYSLTDEHNEAVREILMR
ncbi:polysaccharide pyruvyl transferase CsaB [Anaerosphaera aminiphila DSM 21120]|uniref:Polysaccharide pyruvyl transferase CsaB n=1 Tax=Anaerosphaera aminiphila DSM 21120 TaxID=1120995 RepID=A0A1M5R238_9FIRM|nr:polysaccharide pyruvyl transferase CsaB [Anaerosphaera aminiphila]SHH20241.1 polysaccharide pyruvyl transferase CsaB [Anaerosphaera aminiphila DSM 21120]